MSGRKDKRHAGKAVGSAAGVRHGTRNYELHAETRGSSTVTVWQKTHPNGRLRADGTRAGDWALRVDQPHRGANYAHINTNPRITGRPDPHTRIPEFAPGAAQKGARVLKGANKVMVPAAVAMDGYQTYQSVRADQKHGTTRNTVETVSSIAGGWGGGIAGAKAGAALGSLACPGVGTLAGGVLGGLAGGFAGSYGAGAAAEAIGNANDYDIENRKMRTNVQVSQIPGTECGAVPFVSPSTVNSVQFNFVCLFVCIFGSEIH